MPAYRASRYDLNTCTRLRAIIARRTRRISSSLFPLNITPQITSIQPDSGLVKNPSGLTAALLRRHEDGACRIAGDHRPDVADHCPNGDDHRPNADDRH